MLGRVVKNIADRYDVLAESGERISSCVARGNLKQNGKVLVGDSVEVAVATGSQPIITQICKRKNEFIRPPIANIDLLLIVVSEKPKPDFVLVDKLIINCKLNAVEPCIVLSKEDAVQGDFPASVRTMYEHSGVEMLSVSAKTGAGLGVLMQKLNGKLVCLAGQSAVGKSSLMNALLGAGAKVGDLSKKIERGKNTTRHTEIFYNAEKNIFIADTAGFSKFDALSISYNKIEQYYSEFDGLRGECFYQPCSHIFEKDEKCAVKRALNDCKINKNRYNNYKQIYLQIKQGWENRYE